jgi:hypothetical protein
MQSARGILLCVLSGSTIFFYFISHKGHDFLIDIIEHKLCVSIFSTIFIGDIFHSRKK